MGRKVREIIRGEKGYDDCSCVGGVSVVNGTCTKTEVKGKDRYDNIYIYIYIFTFRGKLA